MTLYQPTYRGKDGTWKKSKVWWTEYRLNGVRKRKSLGVRDKSAAAIRQAEILRRVELSKAGVPTYATAADLEVSALVDEYKAELERRGSADQHVVRTIHRVRRLLGDAQRLAEVTPESVRKALSRVAASGVSARTVNYYRVALHGFFAWLVREGRWGANPVAAVPRVREKEPARRRRALTSAELPQLVSASPEDRGTCYLVAATTGLRRAELGSLRWRDVDLASATITLRAEDAKNRHEAVQPLPPSTSRPCGVTAETARTRIGSSSPCPPPRFSGRI